MWISGEGILLSLSKSLAKIAASPNMIKKKNIKKKHLKIFFFGFKKALKLNMASWTGDWVLLNLIRWSINLYKTWQDLPTHTWENVEKSLKLAMYDQSSQTHQSKFYPQSPNPHPYPSLIRNPGLSVSAPVICRYKILILLSNLSSKTAWPFFTNFMWCGAFCWRGSIESLFKWSHCTDHVYMIKPYKISFRVKKIPRLNIGT